MAARQRYETWKQCADAATKAQLETFQESEIEACFSSEMSFGTAGIRGLMGLGTARLNDYTVRRTARGLAAYVNASGLNRSCAIGYDCRHNSRHFAELCAAALAETGIHVYLYDRLCPTPMLSFAVRYLHCGTGMVISASHNTKEYNGLKCYGPDGCQMTEKSAAAVSEEIGKLDLFQKETVTFEESLQAGTISYIGEDIWEAYYQRIWQERMNETPADNLTVVYSPLCGAGGEPVQEILHRMGVSCYLPDAQKEPSGEFGTCPNPNPENDGAFAESYALADRVHPDLIFATDPDSDRIAAAVPIDGGYRKFNGNEMGCLLMNYVLGAMKEKGTLPEEPVIVKSIVSSPMADAVAEAYGCKVTTVLTGFKYIGETILKLEEQGKAADYILGFEESCGYLKGEYARDKDGVEAAMLICEMASYYKKQGKTLSDVMDELYGAYGYYVAGLQNVVFTDEKTKHMGLSLIERMRNNPAKEIAGNPVLETADFAAGCYTDLKTGTKRETGLPRENMVLLSLGDKGRVILRPSGTEPKMKLYYTAVEPTMEAATQSVKTMQEAMTAMMNEEKDEAK